jgi:RNA polymerase sigma factor (sigma-70 family)
MDDREVIATIAVGDPTGIAVAYDMYATGLYGYCHWLLRQQQDADEALRDTFVIAAITLGDPPRIPSLRPWLYAAARRECRRRLPTSAARSAEANAAGQPADTAGLPTDVGRDREKAEFRAQIRGILAELKPREREVIELSLRHDLYDADLAVALGISRSRAHTLESRARGRLEKALGVVLIARTGRRACPALEGLLADWDGQLTEQTHDLIGGHIDQCELCAGQNRDALRAAALFGLPPPAAPSPGLREQVLRFSSSTTRSAMAYRRRVARRVESVWPARVSQAIRLLRWDSIRRNPGAAIAIVAAVVWVMIAVSVTLLTFVGSHPARAPAARTSGSTPASNPVALNLITTTPAAAYIPAADKVVPSARPTEHAKPLTSPLRLAQPSKSLSAKSSNATTPSPVPHPSPSPSTTG